MAGDALKMLSEHSTAVGLSVVAGTTALWLLTRPQPIQMKIDPNQQSVELPGKEKIHVYPSVKDGKLLEYTFDDVRTVHDGFMRGRQISGDGACYGWRPGPDEPYQWLSYNQSFERAKDIGAGFIHLGCPPKADTYIGIYSINRLEWGLTEQACMMYSMVLIPLYDTLGPDACSFIINQAEIADIVCDTVAKAKLLLSKASVTPALKRIIVIEDITDDVREEAAKFDVEVVHLSQVENLGKENPHEIVPPKAEDVYTICYTSGTTGNPKGAILTHGNMIATMAGFLEVMTPHISVIPSYKYLSYLPLAHGYERLNHALAFTHGAGIGFYQGDVRKLLDDAKDVQPFAFASVPRVFNRIHDKIVAGAKSSFLKNTLFNWAYNSKESEVSRGIIRNDSVWDKLIFNKIQKLLGGECTFMVNGAAPISSETMTFMRVVFGTHFINGYGQTESGVASTVTVPGDHTTGHVGVPLPCNMIKLADVPDMEYYGANNQGEICFKGPNIFHGYLNDPEKTKEALDEDGWLHSGDVGEWLPNGTLKLIDRKKHIFKLAQGEYLAPEKIEAVYSRSPCVLQNFVYGDSFKNFAVAIVVPDRDEVKKLAERLGVSGTHEELCKNKEIKKAILEEMQQTGKDGGLKSFEQAKDIYLEHLEWTAERGLLTPTSKTKRPSVKQHYAEQIDALYQ